VRLFQLILLFLFPFISCQQAGHHEILVKVGEESLSLDEFQGMFPSEIWKELSPSHKMRFLSRWIDQQVLYQAGVSQGLLESSKIQRKLRDFEHKLVGEQYLADEISEIAKPTESQLDLFYQNNQTSYLRQSTVWDYTTLTVKSGKLAWELFEALKSSSFKKSMKWIKKNKSYVIQDFEAQHAQSKCFQKTLKSLKLNRISTPIQCGKGYVLVYKKKTHQEGDVLPFDAIKNQLELDFTENQSKELKKQILEKAVQQTQIILNQDLLSEAN
jgi:hypothetical protein